MGWLKKITRPISKVLDKIIPNEIKPALPYLSAFAPYMLPPGMAGGSGIAALLRRGALTGGINIASQLAQEGSEGEFSGLSALLAAGQGALTAPGAADTLRGMKAPTGDFDPARSFLQKAGDKGLEGLAKGAEFLEKGVDIFGKGGTEPGLNMATLEAAALPVTQGTADLAMITARQALDEYNAGLEEGGDPATYTDDGRRLAIRAAMEAAGHVEDDILDAIASLGLKDGGIIGLRNGGMPPKRGLVDGPGGYAGERNTGLSGLLGSTMLAEDIPEKNSYWISRVSPTKEIDMIKRIYEEKGNEGLQAYLERNPDLNDKYVIVESSAIDGGELTVMPNKLHPDNMEGTVIMMGDGKGGTMEIDMSTMSEENKANGGRIGMWSGGGIKGLWNLGKGMLKGGDDAVDLVKQEKIFREGPISAEFLENVDNSMIQKFIRTRDKGGEGGYGLYKSFDEMPAGLQAAEFISRVKTADGGINYEVAELMIGKKLKGNETIDELLEMIIKPQKKADGGRINKEDGGMMTVLPRGVEMDYRGGGMIPMGSKERADDVPARLSKNEFVMTADAVRAAGGGSVNRGAKRMYDLMHNLEARV